MHPRNRYFEKPPDLTKLARDFSQIRPFVTSSGSLVQSKQGYATALTQTLLQHDFDLSWHIPAGNLCPPLPRSLNYLHWIEDILFTLGVDVHEQQLKLVGIDIGCGASCIFPLLGCRLFPRSKFIASDISSSSIAAARQLVEANGLQNRVGVRQVEAEGFIFPSAKELGAHESNVARFTMCNPPFFANEARAGLSRKRKSGFMGKDEEVWSERSEEVKFVKRMVDEGVARNDLECIKVFTSIVGIKSDVFSIVAYLKSKQEVTFWRVAVLRQGKTFRWCVAWSLGSKFRRKLDLCSNLTKEILDRKLRLKEIEGDVSLKEEEIMKRFDESLATAYTGRFRRNVNRDLVIVYEGVEKDLNALLFSCLVVAKENKLRLILAEEVFADRKSFAEFCQRVQADVVRTNRYWRRRLAKEAK